MPVVPSAASPIRLSVDVQGHEARSPQYQIGSVSPVLSADGRFVVFAGGAENLVPGDTNGCADIFLRDLARGTISRISVDSRGRQQQASQPYYGADEPDISADGRYIVYASEASNLVAGDTNGIYDIFRYDRLTGTTIRVSTASDGAQAAAASPDAYGASCPKISADGRYVAFLSDAPNLVDGDTNGQFDAFVRDLQTGVTTRVSVASDGTQGQVGSEPWTVSNLALSDDGRTVAFVARFANLVPGDTNAHSDVFVHSLDTGETTRVSVSSRGDQGGASTYDFAGTLALSGNGRFVVFASDSPGLVDGDSDLDNDLFLHDRRNGQTSCLTVDSTGQPAKGGWIGAEGASISADGRYIAFASDINTLVPGDENAWGAPTMDVFVRDTVQATTIRLTTPLPENRDRYAASNGITTSLSALGNAVAFNFDRPDLVAGDTNEASDVFAAPVPQRPIVRLDISNAAVATPLSTTGLNARLLTRIPRPTSGLLAAVMG